MRPVRLHRGPLTVEVEASDPGGGPYEWRARVVEDRSGPIADPLRWQHADRAHEAVKEAVRAWRSENGAAAA